MYFSGAQNERDLIDTKMRENYAGKATNNVSAYFQMSVISHVFGLLLCTEWRAQLYQLKVDVDMLNTVKIY